MNRKKKLFVLYDSTAKNHGADEAYVIMTAKSARQAQGLNKLYGNRDYVWFEYEVLPDNELVNETARYDLSKVSDE